VSATDDVTPTTSIRLPTRGAMVMAPASGAGASRYLTPATASRSAWGGARAAVTALAAIARGTSLNCAGRADLTNSGLTDPAVDGRLPARGAARWYDPGGTRERSDPDRSVEGRLGNDSNAPQKARTARQLSSRCRAVVPSIAVGVAGRAGCASAAAKAWGC
jgi:hypothetical protein